MVFSYSFPATSASAIVATAGTMSNLSLTGDLTVGGASFRNPYTVLANYVANTTLVATVSDLQRGLVIPQTTAGVILTLPTPTASTYPWGLDIVNSGTVPLTVHGQIIAAGMVGHYAWTGTAWSLPLTSTVSSSALTWVEVFATSQASIAANGLVQFTTFDNGSGIPYSTSTYQFTLSANKRYRLTASIERTNGTGSDTELSYSWYNENTSAFFGGSGSIAGYNPGSVGWGGIADAIISPTVTTIVDVRFTVVYGANSISTNGGVTRGIHAIIQELPSSTSVPSTSLPVTALNWFEGSQASNNWNSTALWTVTEVATAATAFNTILPAGQVVGIPTSTGGLGITSNGTLITIPSAGRHLLNASYYCQPGAANVFMQLIYNGATVVATSTTSGASSGQFLTHALHWVGDCVAGDTFQFRTGSIGATGTSYFWSANVAVAQLSGYTTVALVQDNMTGSTVSVGNMTTSGFAVNSMIANSAVAGTATASSLFVSTSLIMPARIQTFLANGTFNCPTGITTVYITGVGGGGSGAGSAGGGGSYTPSGPGGGSGAYSLNVAVTVVPGTAYVVTIGASVAGGIGGISAASGSNGSAGNNGNSSSVGTIWTAPGGGGASIPYNNQRNGTDGGPGGSVGTNTLNGTVGSGTGISGYCPGSPGASSPFGGGGGGGRSNASAPMLGFPGGLGAGGGGAGASSMTSTIGMNGGSGGQGYVCIQW